MTTSPKRLTRTDGWAGRARTLAAVLAAFSISFLPVEPAEAVRGADDDVIRVAPDLVVREVEFGRVDARTGKIVPTTIIDTTMHKTFGWRIVLEGARREVEYREQFVLPAPAAKWGVGPETTVAADGASAVTVGTQRLGSTMAVGHAWTHVPGDPKGRYRIAVALEGTPVADISFLVR